MCSFYIYILKSFVKLLLLFGGQVLFIVIPQMHSSNFKFLSLVSVYKTYTMNRKQIWTGLCQLCKPISRDSPSRVADFRCCRDNLREERRDYVWWLKRRRRGTVRLKWKTGKGSFILKCKWHHWEWTGKFPSCVFSLISDKDRRKFVQMSTSQECNLQ